MPRLLCNHVLEVGIWEEKPCGGNECHIAEKQIIIESSNAIFTYFVVVFCFVFCFAMKSHYVVHVDLKLTI